MNYHIIGGYTFYRDFNAASDRILKYIEFSQKFSSGKNVMLEGIIDSTYLITSKALTQEDFNLMQDVYIKINEISDDIYINHIWLARAYSDDDIKKSKKHLNKALELSKSSEGPLVVKDNNQNNIGVLTQSDLLKAVIEGGDGE